MLKNAKIPNALLPTHFQKIDAYIESRYAEQVEKLTYYVNIRTPLPWSDFRPNKLNSTKN